MACGQITSDTFRFCAFVTWRLCVEIHAAIRLVAVKVARVKNHPRNPLMMNDVKRGLGKSFRLDGFDRGVPKSNGGGKICRVGKWQKVTMAGVLSDIMWRSIVR